MNEQHYLNTTNSKWKTDVSIYVLFTLKFIRISFLFKEVKKRRTNFSGIGSLFCCSLSIQRCFNDFQFMSLLLLALLSIIIFFLLVSSIRSFLLFFLHFFFFFFLKYFFQFVVREFFITSETCSICSISSKESFLTFSNTFSIWNLAAKEEQGDKKEKKKKRKKWNQLQRIFRHGIRYINFFLFCFT